MRYTNLRLPLMDFSADLDRSIRVIKQNEPSDGYYGCFSGGKDSVALKHLAGIAGVSVEWHYNVTTIDPPELVKFIRSVHPDVIWNRPKYGSFFRRAAFVKGFPTRRVKWCCEEYKHSNSPRDRVLLMGIRAQESPKRASRWGLVGRHFKSQSKVINPIFHWEAEDLWKWITGEGINYCSLYDEGFKRLGCIGCPEAREAGRRKAFKRWPKYEKKWQWVFKTVWERRHGMKQRDGRIWFGDTYFENWREMWEWWITDSTLPDKLDGRRHEEMP